MPHMPRSPALRLVGHLSRVVLLEGAGKGLVAVGRLEHGFDGLQVPVTRDQPGSLGVAQMW